MKKPKTIINLEEELNCIFQLVELEEIEKWKTKKTSEYSIDEKGNINGISIYNFDLLEIPKAILENIESLNYLISLNLSSNKISDISSLKDLQSIQKLDLGSNQVTDISILKHLYNLQILYIPTNYIADISAIKELKKIRNLNLGDNEIKDISALKNKLDLEMLDLQLNSIEILPEWITDFTSMNIYWKVLLDKNNTIALYDNPIKNIPIEIIKQGKIAIKKYFEELKKEPQQYNFEVKLMVIGEGGTGKTSLLRKLLDKKSELPNAAETTFGIDIQKWNFQLNKTLFEHLPGLKQENMMVNIWDLGGQKIYHGTHQIFFGENTFYILVEESREHKTDFSYWFNTIEQLAGEKANLLVVINEKFGHVIKFDTDGYKTKFGFVNQPIHLDLSKTDDNIVKLQEMVKNAIQFLPNIGQPLPASYIRIKEALFNSGKNFISLDTFLEICSQQGILEFESVKVLSKYLHETGAITHFIDDEVLQYRVFLNSEWLVKTIYKVLDEQTIKDQKGRISKEEVCKIWYAENLGFEINSLTQLMHKFGLMYKVKDKDEYVIPAHLPTEKPYPAWKHLNSGQILQFKYEFGKYMPEGLISHLIVSLHPYIDDEINVWHRGVNLQYGKSFAEIIETYGEINTFEIKISGSQKREMLAIIRHHFLEVIKPFKKLYYKELIPCNCKECINSNKPNFYEFKKLIKRIEDNRLEIECESYEMVNIKNLIDEVILNQKDSLNLLEEKHKRELFEIALEKKFSLEKELITSYDSEKKFALQQQIKELENRILELKKQ
jgi:internalin A